MQDKKSTPKDKRVAVGKKQQKLKETPSDISVNNLVEESLENEIEERDMIKIEILRDVASNFQNLADVITNHSQKICNMEEYLSRFESLFLVFQKNIESRIDEKLSAFENSIKCTISTQTVQEIDLASTKPDLQSKDGVEELKITEKNIDLAAALKSINQAAETIKQKDIDSGIEKRARKSITSLSCDWNHDKNMRRKHYWGYIMNKKKADLYQRWQEETPEFIPRKFRPKKSPGEIPEVSEINVQNAQKRVGFNISEMQIFTDIHLKKFEDIDKQMFAKIDELNLDEATKDKVKEIWSEETEENQHKSLQLWQKKENFLSRKRHEEMQLGLEKCQFAETTWDYVLKHRSRQSKVKFNNQRPHFTDTTH